MRRSTRARWAPLLVALLAFSPVAAGDDARDDSRAAYRRGVQQAESGNYVAARDSFLEAYRLFAHPSILLNLGIARMMTHEYLEAEQDLTRFLSDDGGAPPNEIASARTALADVRTHLGVVLVRVAPGGARVKLDDRAVALIAGDFTKVRTTIGSHALHVEADGYEPVDRALTIDAKSVEQIDLALHRVGEAPAPAATDGSSRSMAGWVLLGSGTVVAGLGLASGVHAKSLADGYNTPNSGSFQDASAKSTGTTFRTLADVAFVTALVAGGVGVYLVLTAPSPSAPQARVVVGPGIVAVTGRF